MAFGRNPDKNETLRSVPLFKDLKQRQMFEFIKLADEVEMEAGTTLAEEGKPGLEFVFILEGDVSVEQDGTPINELSAGGYFGEISLIDGGPRTSTVIAKTDVKLLVIHKRSFDHLLDMFPDLAKQMLVSMCQYVRGTNK